MTDNFQNAIAQTLSLRPANPSAAINEFARQNAMMTQVRNQNRQRNEDLRRQDLMKKSGGTAYSALQINDPTKRRDYLQKEALRYKELGEDDLSNSIVRDLNSFDDVQLNADLLSEVRATGYQSQKADNSYTLSEGSVRYDSAGNVIAENPKVAPAGFEGTGIQNQAMNYLIQGEKDPEFKNTPQYKASVAYMQRPQIIQTERGAIQVAPMDVAGMFGDRKPVASETVATDTVVSDGSPKVIEGTEKTKKYSKDQTDSFTFSGRMIESNNIIKSLTDGGYDPEGLFQLGRLPFGSLSNMMASDEYQKYNQAAENWVTANLRKESGAVIGPVEMEKEIQKYFPQVGDGKDVIEQKAKARAIAERGMIEASGRSRESIFESLGLSSKGASKEGPEEGEIIKRENDRLIFRGGKWQKLKKLNQ